MKLKIRTKYLLINVIFFLMVIILWILGKNFNVNIIILVSYFMYLLIMYNTQPFDFIPYSWMLFISTLNVAGVFVCENSNLFLTELEMKTGYFNSLAPIVLCYLLMYFFMFLDVKKSEEYKIEFNNVKMSKEFLSIICSVGLIIIGYCFIKALSQPYFLLSITRDKYFYNHLSKFEQSIKGHYFMLIPIYAIYYRKYNKKLIYITFITMVILWLFLIGEKFGSLFFVLYLLLMCSSINITRKQIKKYIIIMGIVVIILLGVVYFQRVILSNTKDILYTYFYQRLAQSGQVWWGAYQRINKSNISEIYDEIDGIIPGKNKEFFGQWKMMITCTSCSSARYRAINRIPFSSTTTASIYYYFGVVGLFVIYPIMGFVYKKIIKAFLLNIKNNRVIEAIILSRIIFFIHNMYFASDLSLFAPKGLLFIILYFGVKYFRKDYIIKN